MHLVKMQKFVFTHFFTAVIWTQTDRRTDRQSHFWTKESLVRGKKKETEKYRHKKRQIGRDGKRRESTANYRVRKKMVIRDMRAEKERKE